METMNIFKWVGCLFKGHDDVMLDIAFTPGSGERVVLSKNGKFIAAGKFNHWSTEYENKLQYKMIICRKCCRSIYKEFPRG
jgi:hypothetical protein